MHITAENERIFWKKICTIRMSLCKIGISSYFLHFDTYVDDDFSGWKFNFYNNTSTIFVWCMSYATNIIKDGKIVFTTKKCKKKTIFLCIIIWFNHGKCHRKKIRIKHRNMSEIYEWENQWFGKWHYSMQYAYWTHAECNWTNFHFSLPKMHELCRNFRRFHFHLTEEICIFRVLLNKIKNLKRFTRIFDFLIVNVTP